MLYEKNEWWNENERYFCNYSLVLMIHWLCGKSQLEVHFEMKLTVFSDITQSNNLKMKNMALVEVKGFLF